MKRPRQSLLTDEFKTAPPENVPVDTDEGGKFFVTLYNVKRIASIFDAIRDTSADCNLKFTSSGLDLFAFLADKTTAVALTLDQTIFAQYKCTADYLVTISLEVFAKKMTTMQRFKVDNLSITSDSSGDLIMKGIQGMNVNEIAINSLSSTVPEFNMVDIKYKAYFSLSTEILNRYISNMPNTFEICIKKGGLTFIGKEELARTQLSLKLDDSVIASIDPNYHQTFSKQYLQPLLKSCKLFPMVTLGLENDNPLFARFEICQQATVGNSSVVDLYFSSRLED